MSLLTNYLHSGPSAGSAAPCRRWGATRPVPALALIARVGLGASTPLGPATPLAVDCRGSNRLHLTAVYIRHHTLH